MRIMDKLLNKKKLYCQCFASVGLGLLLAGSAAHAAPVLDGQITSEGWIHLTEDP